MSENITGSTFEEKVLKSDIPVLVDFWAEWCAPCKIVAPVLEEISTEYEDSLRVAKVNVDESPELAEKYQIASIPTLLLIKDGEVLKKQIGAVPKNTIVNMVNEVL